jgi:hypothetical protein
MELVIKPVHALPCELEIFTINGKDANRMDFGEIYDHNEGNAKSPTKEVLDKYNITEEEYYNICNELKDKLFVGGCRWRF